MLSNELKLIRQKALLTQELFAAEVGVTASTINRWEHGKVKPNITAMKNIRDFCIRNNISYTEIENKWLSATTKEQTK